MFLTLCAMAVDDEMFHRCLGISPPGGHRGAAEMVRLAIAIPCSPYFLNGSLSNWLIEASLWGAVPFALPQAHFIFRHLKYWNRVRAREKQLRREKRARKLAANKSTANHSNSTMT
jgi:hypothetical protein